MGELFIKSQRENVSIFLKKLSQKFFIKKITKTIKNSGGSFHLEKEMFLESEIDLEKSYKAKDLFNLLRARTFKGNLAVGFFLKKVNMK